MVVQFKHVEVVLNSFFFGMKAKLGIIIGD